MKFLRDC